MQAEKTRDGSFPSRLARIVSEVAGPTPLIFVCILEVGLTSGTMFPTIVAIVTMAIIPTLIMIRMIRGGKVSDRLVSERRQRVPYLVVNLFFFAAGATAVVLLQAPAALAWLVTILTGGLLIVTVINFRWKISIHATLSAFFVGIQIHLLGPLALIFLLMLSLTIWARHALEAHTNSQLLAGTGLGLGMILLYVLLA